MGRVGQKGNEGSQRTPIRLLILRASYGSTEIGSSDLRVWSKLADEFESLIVLQSRRRADEYSRGPVSTMVLWVPHVPLFGWLILNTIVVLKLRRQRCDLIVTTPRSWLAGRILMGLGVSSKSIVDVRSGPTHPSRFMRWLELVEIGAAMRLSAGDGMTFVSEGTRREALGGRSRDVPTAIWGSGVDLDLFRPSGKRRVTVRNELAVGDSKVIIYHGTVSRDRGIGQLLKATEIVRARGIEAKIVVLGWGPDLASLQREFRDLVSFGAAIFRPIVRYEDVPSMIDACDVGVLPFPVQAKWEFQRPLKLLEYLAMRKAVVATDMEAHRGYGRGVILVPDNEPETLADGLIETLQHSEAERARLVEDSFIHVKELSWDAQASILESFIRGLLEA